MTLSPVQRGDTVGAARGPVLLFFTRKTSGPARRMESLVAHVARKERRRLRVSHVDVDEQTALAETLHVRVVPELVLVAQGQAVARLAGRATAAEIDDMIRTHLDE